MRYSGDDLRYSGDDSEMTRDTMWLRVARACGLLKVEARSRFEVAGGEEIEE